MTWIGWAIVAIVVIYAAGRLESKLARIEVLLMEINDVVRDLEFLAEQGREKRLIRAEGELDGP